MPASKPFTTPPGLRGAGLAVAVFVPLILGWTGLELQRELSRTERQRVELDRSHATRSQIQKVFSLVQDAETGQRGYIITGQPRFLEPYQEAQHQLASQLRLLDRLFVQEPAQQARLTALRSGIRAKDRVNEQGIEARRQQGAAAATAIVATGEGRRAMDEIRSVVREMTLAEAASLDGRRREAARLTVETRRTVQLLFGMLVAVLAGVALLVWRSTRVRQALLREVRSQAARQQAVFDSTMDAIITLNASGSIESVNRAAQTLFGYEAAELSRRDISCLVDVTEEMEGSFLSRLNASSPIGSGVVKQTTALRKDGSRFHVEVALSEMRLPDGVRLVAAVRDISERKRVERMKDEFVSTVSHELRTPLTSIAGSLGLLRGGAAGPLPETAGRLISIAANNSERLVRLINDILDMEKIAAGSMPFEMQPLGLRALLARSIEGLNGYADQLGVKFVLEPGPEVEVKADPDRLVQVATNLLSNAAKFSPVGSVVEVTVSGDEHGARASIRDHGPGIPESFRHRIFSKFAQADSSDTRQKGGTGLGLAIAREIVEKHAGRLSFETQTGRGTVFHMDLPLAGGRRASAPVAPSAPRELIDPAAPRPLILHVEDDPDVGEVV
ncbi:MAG: CHASE3 domain-containing protein [Proteobacteria bacterium]|nr:CHASE3 domain-containing protein [Pseudomonadota bacterium]